MIMQKIFQGESDDEIHNAFVKFSRGEFKDKYLVNAKKQGSGKYAVKAGAEYVNELVRSCLMKASNPVSVKGIIVSTLDLRDEIPFDVVKTGNFQGIRKNQINTELNPQDVLDLMNKYPKVFFALSFKGKDFDLKVKPKAPKSSKPGKDDEDASADFCTLKTNNVEMIQDLFFGIGLNWNEVSINHTLNITGIVYPNNLESLKPAEVREQSKREGEITRRVIVDGEEVVTTTHFVI
jgi:hypothetical protein